MATQTFANTDLVSDMVIASLFNKAQKVGLVGRETEGDFNTAKYGQTINMRRPVYFASSSGAVIQAGQTSAIEEGTVAVVVDNREKVVIELDSQEMALNVTSDRVADYVNGMADELLNVIEQSIADEARTGVWNYGDASGGATLDEFARARAFMAAQGVSAMSNKYGCVTPFVGQILSKEVSTAFSFPSVVRVSDAMDRAKIGTYNTIMFMEDQVLATHVSGVATGTIVVDGNDQNVTYNSARGTYEQTLNLTGATIDTTGIFKAGDVLNIDTFQAINRKTRKSIGKLQGFLVTEDADSDGAGAVTVTISPPIIAETGVDAAFNTVDPTVTDVTAMDGLAVSTVTGTDGEVRKENLIFAKEAFTIAMIDLPSVSDSGANSSTKSIDGLSLRLTRQYQINSDKVIYRCEALWAVKAIQPYYAFRIGTVE